MKLIKLSDTHYIISSDDNISEGDFCVYKTGEVIQYFVKLNTDNLKKITHSTQPLEPSIYSTRHDNKGYLFIKPLTLSEVEEAIKNNPSVNNEWNIYFDENNKISLLL